MKAYQPKIEALLIKSRRRKEVFAGLPVGQKQAWVGGVDLTDWLGESGGVRLMKGVGILPAPSRSRCPTGRTSTRWTPWPR